MRNAERMALKMGQAEQIAGDRTLDLPESEEKPFKFKSIYLSARRFTSTGDFSAVLR